jgi:hypothetical protein
MSVPILNNANRILSALDEGIVRGIIFTLEYKKVPIIPSNVLPILQGEHLQWDTATCDFWLSEYGISEEV